MHYFIYPQKDSYISTEFSKENFGSDEILELRKIFSGSFSTSAEAASRILIQFDYSDISASIVDGIITNPKFYLRYYEVEGQSELDKTYSLSSHPISQSWEEGIGKYYHNPKTENRIRSFKKVPTRKKGRHTKSARIRRLKPIKKGP